MRKNQNYLRIKLDKDKPIVDYTTKELTAYLIQNYSGDPIAILVQMLERKEIATSVYVSTRILLEGLGYDKGR